MSNHDHKITIVVLCIIQMHIITYSECFSYFPVFQKNKLRSHEYIIWTNILSLNPIGISNTILE